MTDLIAWAARVQASVDTVMLGFEERSGCAPDDNFISSARGQGGDALREVLGARAPSAVVEFFDAIEEVCLPDVWNGYFLGPVDRVVDAYVGESPRLVSIDGESHEVLLVGSDGGGAFYCVLLDEPAPVVRLDQVSIQQGLASTPSGFTQYLAPSFPGFLDAIALAVETSAHGEEPPVF